jgi:hypothetical protein
MTEIEGMELKEQQTPNKQGTQPTSFWIDVNQKQGKREREKQNPHSFDQLVMEQTKVGRKES